MQALSPNEAEALANACDVLAVRQSQPDHVAGDREAERLAIAYCIVLGNLHPSATRLSAGHFSDDRNRKIWGWARDMQTTPTPEDLGLKLSEWEAFDTYETRHLSPKQWPSIEQRIVRSAATRKLMRGLDDVQQKLARGGSEVLDAAVEAVAALQADCAAGLPDEAITMRDAIVERVRQMGEDARRENHTLPMHPQLQAVYGGWRRKKVYAVVARSSEHKTTFGLDALDRICKAGCTGVIFTMEDDAGDMAARCMARNTRHMTLSQISSATGGWSGGGALEDLQALTNSEWVLRQRVIDHGAPKWGLVKSLVHAAHAKQKIDALMLDYGQLIQPDRNMGLYDHFRVVSAESQRLAKELDAVLFIMLQVDKQAGRDSKEANKPPSTLDAMGGAMWHNNVFGSVCLSKNDDGTLTAWVDKWKDGPQREFRLGLRASKDQILD